MAYIYPKIRNRKGTLVVEGADARVEVKGACARVNVRGAEVSVEVEGVCAKVIINGASPRYLEVNGEALSLPR